MYKKDVIKLYKELSKKHNCTYKLEFNNKKTTLGFCNYTKKTISISVPYLKNNPKRLVRNTILHEIAHALTDSGHDRKWRLKCKEIGWFNPSRLNYEASVPGKWVATCPKCGYIITRHRKTKIACGKCCDKYNEGKFSSFFLMIFKENK